MCYDRDVGEAGPRHYMHHKGPLDNLYVLTMWTSDVHHIYIWIKKDPVSEV